MADWAGFPEAEGGCITSNDKQIILNERENKWRYKKRRKTRTNRTEWTIEKLEKKIKELLIFKNGGCKNNGKRK